MKRYLLIIPLLLLCIAGFSQKKVARPKTADQILNETYCSGLFSTSDGVYFDLLDNTATSGFFNIFDWLNGRVAGLQVYTTRNNVRLPYIRNQLAGVYVDEIRRDPDFLNLLPVTDIAMIKVIKGPFLGGFGGASGAIAIYTIGTEDEVEE
jgi:hypothetical protein